MHPQDAPPLDTGDRDVASMTPTSRRDRARAAQWSVLGVAIVLISAIVWASWAQIDQTARATGRIIPQERVHQIQAAIDGVVAAMHVREGQSVQAGQLLFELERSQTQAAVDDARGKVAAARSALARLRAEVLGQPLRFDPDLEQNYPSFVDNQRALYQRRQQALNAELRALQESLNLVERELTLLRPLAEQGDVGMADVIRLQRQAAEIRGQMTNRKNKFLQDAQADMTKVEEELSTQQQVLLERQTNLQRTRAEAPAAGIVKNIVATTPGARVRAGDVVLEIVPSDSPLVFEAQLSPADVGQVQTGQAASVRLDAFDFSRYGLLHGRVTFVSPDATIEKVGSTEKTYYRVHIHIDPEQSSPALLNAQLQPGMTGIADITLGQRSVLEYLLKPLNRAWHEALTER